MKPMKYRQPFLHFHHSWIPIPHTRLLQFVFAFGILSIRTEYIFGKYKAKSHPSENATLSKRAFVLLINALVLQIHVPNFFLAFHY